MIRCEQVPGLCGLIPASHFEGLYSKITDPVMEQIIYLLSGCLGTLRCGQVSGPAFQSGQTQKGRCLRGGFRLFQTVTGYPCPAQQHEDRPGYQ
jgi:hypothetical protein